MKNTIQFNEKTGITAFFSLATIMIFFSMHSYSQCNPDVMPPTASNPLPINVESFMDVPFPDVAVVTDEADNCTINPWVTWVSDFSDDQSCPETISRTFNVVDDDGNMTMVTQTITIQDITPPVFAVAPVDTMVNCIGDVPVMTNLGWTDNSDGAGSVAGSDGALVGGDCGGTITRTWTYTDVCGNVAMASQTIAVNDATLPTASNPTPITASVGSVPAIDVNVVFDESDNCSPSPVVAFVSETSDGESCPETITRIYSVTDDCGNTINVTQILTIYSAIDNSVSLNGSTLTATASGYLYQWVDCNNGNAPITEATSQFFTPSIPGSYSVLISDPSCEVLSECIVVNIVGLNENNLGKLMKIYPVPTTGKLTVKLGGINENVKATIKSVTGQVLKVYTLGATEQFSIELLGSKGVYFVEVETATSKPMTFRVLKE
ncbi:MAG: T9SS type A sorting domain-containing protein [Crocinitomicaceae bacterium]|nr:T9SS type A sorting domain-containing protein [Crocinitomicaceae bacterium]